MCAPGRRSSRPGSGLREPRASDDQQEGGQAPRRQADPVARRPVSRCRTIGIAPAVCICAGARVAASVRKRHCWRGRAAELRVLVLRHAGASADASPPRRAAGRPCDQPQPSTPAADQPLFVAHSADVLDQRRESARAERARSRAERRFLPRGPWRRSSGPRLTDCFRTLPPRSAMALPASPGTSLSPSPYGRMRMIVFPSRRSVGLRAAMDIDAPLGTVVDRARRRGAPPRRQRVGAGPCRRRLGRRELIALHRRRACGCSKSFVP